MQTTAAFVFAMLASFLSVHAKEAGCLPDSQAGTACTAAPSPGGTLFAVRQDAKPKGSVHEEENHGGSKKATAVAEETVSKAESHTKRATDTAREKEEDEEGGKGMCKHARITLAKAYLPAQNSSIDPYVKVTYKSKQNADLTFQTDYVGNTVNPTWNHIEEVLLCNNEAPLHFAVYNRNWVLDTLLDEGELHASQFWEEGFSGNLLLEGGSHVYVKIES